MKKIYVVIDACSGEDYSADEPNLLLVSENFDEANQFFKNEIENWRPEDADDEDSGFEDETVKYQDGTIVYEATDFYGDSHRVMKLVTYEL